MALILTTVRDTATFVHTTDPDVTLAPVPEGTQPLKGWILESEAARLKPTATKVTVRPLAGHEMMSAWAAGDLGQQALAIASKAVTAIDGQAPSLDAFKSWGWEVLLDLRRRIEDVSTSPTSAHR